MNNQEFIKYTATRYGIDENTIETMIDIFASSLQEVIAYNQKVIIDEIGEFQPAPTPTPQSTEKNINFIPSRRLLSN